MDGVLPLGKHAGRKFIPSNRLAATPGVLHPTPRDTYTSLSVAALGLLPGTGGSCYYSGSMSTRHALLKLLADGAFHSGPVLG
ncbi:MAG: hypothetical protein H6R46_931, partial [Proteobacteria bacterium]|nr:hypothetical protein [Pseudomonadota bacterium]